MFLLPRLPACLHSSCVTRAFPSVTVDELSILWSKASPPTNMSDFIPSHLVKSITLSVVPSLSWITSFSSIRSFSSAYKHAVIFFTKIKTKQPSSWNLYSILVIIIPFLCSFLQQNWKGLSVHAVSTLSRAVFSEFTPVWFLFTITSLKPLSLSLCCQVQWSVLSPHLNFSLTFDLAIYSLFKILVAVDFSFGAPFTLLVAASWSLLLVTAHLWLLFWKKALGSCHRPLPFLQCWCGLFSVLIPLMC